MKDFPSNLFNKTFTKADYYLIEAAAHRAGWNLQADRDPDPVVGLVLTFEAIRPIFNPQCRTRLSIAEIFVEGTSGVPFALERAYRNYDIDHSVYSSLDYSGHGKDGMPYHVRDVLFQCEEYARMLDRLRDEVTKAIAKAQSANDQLDLPLV
ncbi:MAG: hypothetical protein Q4E62_07450 [Sutterellaceae bacterium]|nr:hypothetical protein [Sutterellaceae bacterium]